MRGVGTDQPRSPISCGHCWHQEMPLGTLWVGSKQRSSRTLTAQHQALLGCLPHRLFVGLAQVNQLLDALLGLQEKGQRDEVWLSGLEQEHSQMGRAAQGTAAPWCRKAPHPLSSLLFFLPALPPPAATAHLGHSQLFSPRSRGLCRCVQSHQPLCFLFLWNMQPSCLLPPSLTFKQPSAAHPATRVCTSSSSSCSRKHTRAWGRWGSQCHNPQQSWGQHPRGCGTSPPCPWLAQHVPVGESGGFPPGCGAGLTRRSPPCCCPPRGAGSAPSVPPSSGGPRARASGHAAPHPGRLS